MSNAWLRCFRPKPNATVRLFCFPFVGAGSLAYRAWTNLLPDHIEVYAVLLPGRESRMREQPMTHLRPIVDSLIAAIEPYLDKPFAFFGHSLGATIAFELIEYLRIQGRPLPYHLFVSAARAPHIISPFAPMHTLTDHEFVVRLRRFNGTPESILRNHALMKRLLPTLRADFMVHETHQFTERPQLNCPIMAFGGTTDPIITHNDLNEWRHYTASRFTQHTLFGDHFFINGSRAELLELVSDALLEPTYA